MFPNQRRAMLVSSPGLVIYAELLLLAQYVFSLHLTDDELPESIEGINLAEIGLVKSRTLACLPILVKVINGWDGGKGRRTDPVLTMKNKMPNLLFWFLDF